MKIAYEKELYGEDYAWISAMSFNADLFTYIDENYADDKEDILEVMNGAQSLGIADIKGDVGDAYATNYAERYGVAHTFYGMYTYDALYMYANTIHTMLNKGDDLNNGKELASGLKAVDFTGASGSCQITGNDRNAIGYSVLNVQDGAIV